MIQNKAIYANRPHSTALKPWDTTVNPTIPPMMECAEEIGISHLDATANHKVAAIKAHVIPSMRMSSCPSKE